MVKYTEYGDYVSQSCLYKELTACEKAKQIEVDSSTLWYIDKNNTLYGCGYRVVFNSNTNSNIENAVKIRENVRQVKCYGNSILYITQNNQLYVRTDQGKTEQINQFEINEDSTLLGYGAIITNGKLYRTLYNNTNFYQWVANADIAIYYNNYESNKFISNKNIGVFVTNNEEIYIKDNPNITKIQEKSNYTLKKVFSNAIFVQGSGTNISIVDKNGNIYESVVSNANTVIRNAKKIMSSNYSKFVVQKSGEIWAKGYRTGMWGETDNKDEYVKITQNGVDEYKNVKNVFTSNYGLSAIFITEDNKIYWAGNTGYVMLPQIKGDYTNTYGENVTSYPKEVTSKVLDSIKGQIKDIEYSFVYSGGIYVINTMILTEDGKLYIMSNNKNLSGNNTTTTQTKGDFTELTIKEGTTVKQILTEDGLSLALLSNGEVYGWGYNTYGILGPSYEVGGVYSTPVKLEGLPANIRYMSLGTGFAIFASKSGEVYGIGKNDYGQLGTGDSIGRTEFVRCTRLEE